MSLESSCAALVGHYPVAGWWPARSRFEVMVGAVLVQNTRWANVEAGIRNLRGAGHLSPAGISALPPASLIAFIRPAGCQSVKARRLRALAAWVCESGGLRRLASQETDNLRRGLLGVHGVGPETADAILCFAFRRPIFIADQYARRWLGRMGLLSADDSRSYERSRRAIETRLNGSTTRLSDVHAAIVLHGQSICGREPRCASCVVRAQCRFSRS
jgi:endonuclease-3 related protein